MTTEVLAALRYSPANGIPFIEPTPYEQGRAARRSGSSMLQVPYARLTIGWTDWRTGWLAQDASAWYGNGCIGERNA